MRSMTLLLFFLLTATVFAQSEKPAQKAAVPTPPPLTKSSKTKPKTVPTRTRKKSSAVRPRSKNSRRTSSVSASASKRKPRVSSKKTKNSLKKSDSKKPPTNAKSTKLSQDIVRPSGIPDPEAPKDTKEDSETSSNAATALAQKESQDRLEANKTADQKPMKASDRIPFMSQTKENEAKADSDTGSWMTVFGAVGIVLGLIFLGTWIVKKFGLFGVTTDATTEDTDLELLATLSPRPGQTLTVVNFNGENLLLGSTDQGFTVLSKQTPLMKDANVTTYPKPVPIGSLLDEVEVNDFQTALESASRRETLSILGGGR